MRAMPFSTSVATFANASAWSLYAVVVVRSERKRSAGARCRQGTALTTSPSALHCADHHPCIHVPSCPCGWVLSAVRGSVRSRSKRAGNGGGGGSARAVCQVWGVQGAAEGGGYSGVNRVGKRDKRVSCVAAPSGCNTSPVRQIAWQKTRIHSGGANQDTGVFVTHSRISQ